MNSEETTWDRQKKEIESYNLFYSSITGRKSNNSFSDNGYIIPSMFPEITDQRNNITAKPDFTLYNNQTFLLVEIKSGDNINKRDIQQIENCNNLSKEAIEEFLENTEIPEKTKYNTEIDNIESCIVYQDIDEEWIKKCRQQWENCREKLEDLEQKTAILTQDYGRELRILEGKFSVETLQNILDKGIKLPENPKTELLLTENKERESLAIAISLIWGGRVAKKEQIDIDIEDIRSFFAPQRQINISKLRSVLSFLSEIGACREKENKNTGSLDKQYYFSREDIETILNIENIIEEKGSIENIQEDLSDQQSDLSEF